MANLDAAALARRVADLERRLTAMERGSQGDFRSFRDDDGNAVSLMDLAADVAAAVDNGDQAMTEVSTRGAVYYQDTPPDDPKPYDVWFDTDNDYLPHSWDGTTWVASPFGTLAISNLDAGIITTGILNAILVRTSSGAARVELDPATHSLVFYQSGFEMGRVESVASAYENVALESAGTSLKVFGGGDPGVYVDGGRIQANDGLSFDLQTQTLLNLTGDTATVTLDSNGEATISHGMFRTPQTVVANIATTQAEKYVKTGAFTTSTFTVRVFQADGSVAAGQTTVVHWLALR